MDNLLQQKTTRKRFLDRIAKMDEYDDDACWLWGGGIRRGYGRFYHAGKWYAAHRLMYVYMYGEPQERDLHHTCEVKHCVNPLHIKELSRSEHKIVTIESSRLKGEKNG